ncbi:hypothetical protein GH714_012386 [Hevea brasiliensis]|uniref:Exocyst subunit Exo70 family protein n=1 Tax=Hevea brasiliensis TaxID=3981 RepID=A0A6A6KJ11_HEVBR|nr:hypothetical protein GH714_012386 [Hevea brasiliensis]
MPRKGMRSICFHPKTPSFSTSPRSSPSRASLSTPRRSFSESIMEQTIEAASNVIMKWNPETSTFARVTSLFYENKREAMQFLKCVTDLQKAMHLLVSDGSSHGRIVRAQNLMQIAMKRLQKEFYQILSTNRAYLDPESVSARSSRASTRSSISDYDDEGFADDEIRAAGDSISEVEQVSSIAMADLRSIAECMISSGYAKECVNVYKIIRKSIIDEGIYRLGVERMSPSQINKMDWAALDLRIKNWLEAVKISLRTLFNGERILCDHVFSISDSIRESCFSEISREGANLLFGFPELVAKTKKSPMEKIFRVLDMYTAISENCILSDIISDWPPLAKSSLPKSYFDSPESDDTPAPPISVRFAWLILVLLCKLDGKAKHYKDYLLGEEWITKHEAKVRQFAANYERLAWSGVRVIAGEYIGLHLAGGSQESLKRFNSSFEAAYRKQSSCIVSDPKLRDEVKVSIARKLTPVYREFYGKVMVTVEGKRNIRIFVRYAPEDLETYLSNLFFGTIDMGSSSSSPSTPSWSTSSHRPRSRLSS